MCCVIGMVGLRGDNKVIGHEHTHVESGGRRCAWGGNGDNWQHLGQWWPPAVGRWKPIRDSLEQIRIGTECGLGDGQGGRLTLLETPGLSLKAPKAQYKKIL